MITDRDRQLHRPRQVSHQTPLQGPKRALEGILSVIEHGLPLPGLAAQAADASERIPGRLPSPADFDGTTICKALSN